MPILGYVCEECGLVTERLVSRTLCPPDYFGPGRIVEDVHGIPQVFCYKNVPSVCPECGSERLRRRFGRFNFSM